jgi:pyruvate dehydrogenase E2 component (dihydrolipoamide acetyltransferase)
MLIIKLLLQIKIFHAAGGNLMAQRIVIPRLGQTMTEGTVIRWLKEDGEIVNVNDDIFELEYDKSTAFVQAKKYGILRLLSEEGITAPVGETVAVILENDETLEDVISKKPASQIPGISGASLSKKQPEASLIKTNLVTALPNDTVPEARNKRALKTSPLAKKIAKDLAVDIYSVIASDGKRITKKDVLTFVKTSKFNNKRREPLRGVRKIISERMTQSYFTYPTVTLTTDADMYEFMRYRDKFNEKHSGTDIKLTVTDLIVAAVARALRDHANINASIDGQEIVYHENINIGIAVNAKNGLVVPVVSRADTLKLESLTKKTKCLILMAREGTITDEDMKGGTFTVTNLGTEGIDAFNPIINYPESAILGVGRTIEKVVVLNGQITIRPKAIFSLTHDHRLIDGYPAAKFLRTIINYIENPEQIEKI